MIQGGGTASKETDVERPTAGRALNSNKLLKTKGETMYKQYLLGWNSNACKNFT
jgi:hypothetical protein